MIIVSVRHSPAVPLWSGSRESLPSIRMLSEPFTGLSGRPALIAENGSERSMSLAMVL
jgi:hypothetical protein